MDNKIPVIKTAVKGGETKQVLLNDKILELYKLDLSQRVDLLDLLATFVPLLRETMGDKRFYEMNFLITDETTKKTRFNLKHQEMACVLFTLMKKPILTRVIELIAASAKKPVEWFEEQNVESEGWYELFLQVAELNKIGELFPFFQKSGSTQNQVQEVPQELTH